ncbi:MAG: putative toxin-antitoxin system toxin component, PIN family [Methanospirillaceae archaeon]|nr:putative toxin-antitoxin system toxin component, PIN family [Methanospirillaceae archaeon]
MIDRVVVDTNVLVSALISPYGNPAIIIRLIVSGSLRLVLDNRVFQEYLHVLFRPKFQFTQEQRDGILIFLKNEGLWTVPAPLFLDLPDPADLPFIELSLHIQAPVITGNTRHFSSYCNVLTPADFLEQYKKKGI